MNSIVLTNHAAVRMAQRGFDLTDIELIALLGTEVEDGILVRANDCQEAERLVKKVLERIRRIRGKRLVVATGKVVTAYHASKKHHRNLLRNAREGDLQGALSRGIK